MEINSIADKIIGLYLTKGNSNYAGEAISQLEHACQSAQYAELDGNDVEVILAAFLHDIGHLIDEDGMNGFGAINHEEKGSEFLLKYGFSEKVAKLVKSHVQAKRYLCFASKSYYNQLSEASKTTLNYQGGLMSEKEASAFERHPLKIIMIKMRTWDEMAKEINKPLPDLNMYREMIIHHLIHTKKYN
jgi:phosphonate degradation associated HDIG domain protein